MTSYPSRAIATVGSPLVPFDFLQSLFAAELLRPSSRLWISSPWVSDVEVVDNRARQFGSLCPDWPAARIRLSAVLATLLERGARIVLIVNEDKHNDDFVDKMRNLQEQYGNGLKIIRSANLHEKGIVGDHFRLTGSMNMTYRGVYVNEENLTYTSDPAEINERRITLEFRWKDYL
jgi:phosphatidylserine/phosphatidylglycerophosphate/cardiolipin synthase-like enzyme